MLEAEAKLKEAWRELIPQLDETEKEILTKYMELRVSTPYRVASELNLPTSKVYRKVKKLVEKRLLLPLRFPSKETLHISVKGCLALYVMGLISFDEMFDCFYKLWDVKMSKDELLGFLYLLSIEIRKRELNLKTTTMCRVDEASIHVLRFLKRAIMVYLEEGKSFPEALNQVAKEVDFDRILTREGIRLGLKGIAKTLPIVVNLKGHKVVILFHDQYLFPFVIECDTPCVHFKESLGFECPLIQEKVFKAGVPIIR